MSQAIPAHEFHGRAWFFWYLMVVFVGIGAAAIAFGLAMLSGVISNVDVHGVAHPEGPPIVIAAGFGFILVPLVSAWRSDDRYRPILRCCREGIECRFDKASDDGWLSEYRRLWLMVTMRMFESRWVRIPWQDFQDASIQRGLLGKRLVLNATGFNVANNKPVKELSYVWLDLRGRVDDVAAALNGYASDAAARQRLSSWTVAK